MKKEETSKQEEALNQALDILAQSGMDMSKMFESGGVLKQLTKGLVERALEAEMDHHIGYTKHERSKASSNARNGKSSKKLITQEGVLELEVPRDRESSFEPEIVPKRTRKLKGFDEKIIYLYSKGHSTTDIADQLKELYGAEVSTSLISQVTDAIIHEVQAWQNRPLEAIYPIVYFDCLVVKVREDNRIKNKAVYLALGINLEGKKEVLGLWMSENEGAKFWLHVFTELKNRGLEDILISCTDNLKGMTQAISSVYPKTEHQLCIVHQIRQSLKYVSYKDRKLAAQDLKLIYTATNEEQAKQELENFKEKWDNIYPQISQSWLRNWEHLVLFLAYPPQIRKIIYTTNAIESLNSQFRKVIKNKKIFPHDKSVCKMLYLAIEQISRKWTMPVQNWNQSMSYFIIQFEDRISNHL